MLKLKTIKEQVESIKSKFDLIPKEKLKTMETECNKVDYSDLFAFQTVQSLGFATLHIDYDASMWLYNKIGGDLPSPKKWKALPLEEKLVITTILGALKDVESGNPGKTH